MRTSPPGRSLFRRIGRIALVALALALFLLWSNLSLQVSRVSLSLPGLPRGFEGTKIVVLGDSHGQWFGAGNQRLFSAVSAQQPDFIFFVGDLEDKLRGPEPHYPETMARGLSQIAPSYYVTGNHEWAIGHVRELKTRLSQNGMTVLSNEFLPLERGGDAIILAGIDDPNGFAGQKSPEELARELHEAWGEPFWILLAHIKVPSLLGVQ